MRDLFSWSIPLGRLFGVQVKIHILFPLVVLGLILHHAFYKPYEGYTPIEGAWVDAVIMGVLLFGVVLIHEFGHVFGARSRWVEGDAQEVLMWPLGGLAFVDIPRTARAHFITAAAGPFANVVVCAVCVCFLLVVSDTPLRPPLNPFPSGFPFRIEEKVAKPEAGEKESKAAEEPKADKGDKTDKADKADKGDNPKTSREIVVQLTSWSGDVKSYGPYSLPVWIARTFWISYFLFLFNVVLIGFPMDSGRLLQSALWPYLGFRQATLVAVFAGFVLAFIVGLYAIVQNEVLALALAIFVYVMCRQEWVTLEMGAQDSLFGYDFSQGYTSLEREEDDPQPRKRVSWWKRWLQRRAARKAQKEREDREAEERRLDELLAKIAREGKESLTEEERRFMMRVSDRYKHRP
jgi:stage IV sporulation protein FB